MKRKYSLSPEGSLTFGFDIGIASVGWCVLGEKHIVDLGVRCFDKAEIDSGKDAGKPNNLERRTARLIRRRLRRRAWRLVKLTRLLKREGVIDDIQLLRQPATQSPWQLRVKGLDRKLDPEEWARVLYHLCKHRGFYWISRAEEKKAEADGEGGKVKQGLLDTQQRRSEKNYRTAAEMVLNEFPEAQRNKQGEYAKALSRLLLAEELVLLFKHQREYGNPHATPDLEMHIAGCGDRKSGLFWEQKPPLSGAALLKMLGRCTFEKGEYRAPKASFTAERRVWLTKLVSLKIVVDGITRGLEPEEIQNVLSRPYENKPHKNKANPLTYKQLHRTLVEKCSLPESFTFAGLTGKKDKDPLDQTLIALHGWQNIWRALEKAGLETEWQSIAGAATGGQPELLDQIAWVLSVFKDGNEIEQELRKLPLPGGERMIEALSEISFDKFHNLSLKALRKIVPHMETGLRYDEACKKAGYHHSQLFKVGEGQQKYLPPFYSGRDKDGRMVFDENEDVPRNPVVLRSLNQARKVLNALVSRYGSPSAVHIEMARDLSRPMDERNKIKKTQDEYREKNEKAKADFEAEYSNVLAKNRVFEKFLLYREQHGSCPYCQKELAHNGIVHEIFEIGATEIDHVLPYSRSFDNSKNNRVLVHTKCNRDKGDRTPYEYLTSFGGEEGKRWIKFKAWVEDNNYRLAKKQRLLRQNFGEKESKEFMARNLNDTRYICRFFKNYVEKHLFFSGEGKRCVAVNGGLTSLLRAKWGLPTNKKKREESDRHHAMDAVVVAACGHLIVQRTSTMFNTTGWTHKPDQGGYINAETSEFLTTQEFVRLDEVSKLLPRPWKYFRQELLLRLNTDDPATLKAEAERSGYPPELLEYVRPLFVSRAPQRRNSGALHKETIYGKNRNEPQLQGTAINRKAVGDLKEGDLDKIVGAHEARNKGLITSLRQWLQSKKELDELVASLGKGKLKREPTPDEQQRIDELTQPPRKPLKNDPENGPFTGPIIKKIKLVGTQKSGAYIRNGVAESGQVIYTKLYRHGDDFLFWPRYELPDEKLFGLPTIPPEAVDTGVKLYSNDVVKIVHPNLSHCYKAIRTYKDDETGEKLIDIVAAFPTGAFLGYWSYFEPSNNRPVVQLHDSAKFFLLEANKEMSQKSFTLIEKKKVNKKGKEVYEYLEKSPPMDRRPFKFSLEENIKRQIGDARSFKKLHVDTLGNIYPAPSEKRRGLA